MLETVRAYAAERLTAGDDERDTKERHHRFYLALARVHGADPAINGPDGAEHMARLDAEVDNLHAALGWACEQEDAERALALAVALGRYWGQGRRNADAVTWSDRALGLPGADDHPELQVRALRWKVWGLRWIGRVADQPASLSEAEAIARRLGDPLLLAQTLGTRASSAAMAGRPEIADPLADESLRYATEAGDRWEIASAWSVKAMAASTGPDLRERVERAAALLEEVGNRHDLAGLLLGSAAYTALFVGSDRDAKEYLERAIPLVRESGDPWQRMIHRGNTGLAALLTADVGPARAAFREELELCRELVALPIACEGLIGLAGVAAAREEDDRAARLVGAASAHRHGSQQDTIEARLDAAYLAAARARCGASVWEAVVAEGTALSFEDAIAYALEEAD